MSTEEQRKHKIITITPQAIATGVKYRVMGSRGTNDQDEGAEDEDAKVEEDSKIHLRRKRPIISSIVEFRRKYNEKVGHKREVIKDRKFDKALLRKLSQYETNLFNIFFYKILSPALTEKYIKHFKQFLGLKSFVFVKKDFNNTCITCTLDYDDSIKLLGYFDHVVAAHDRNKVDAKLRELGLVKRFELIDKNIKQKFSLHLERNETYNIFVPSNCINGLQSQSIQDVAEAFNLTLTDFFNKVEGLYLSISGHYGDLQHFLLFFEVPEYVFSMEIRTRMFSDPESPSVTKKELKKPPMVLDNISELPIVFLMDSGLPSNRLVLNSLIEPLVINQKVVPSLEEGKVEEGKEPVLDHAPQMAGIILYGQQLHNITENEYGAFIGADLTAYARIFSLYIGIKRPQVGIRSFTELFELLRNEEEVKHQSIKIFNLSFNVRFPKKDNENISFLSYMIDKYLFFHPDLLIVNSVGNYEGDCDDNFFTYPNCNINIPSDAINIISVGSFGVGVDKKCYIGQKTSKNHYDKGVIKNQLKPPVNDWKGIKKADNHYLKPDLLGLGNDRTSTVRTESLSFLVDSPRNGTSHATAYISHISARILSLYPELKYAMSIENILLKFTGNFEEMQHSIQIDKDMCYSLKNRIQDLTTKSTLSPESILDSENRNVYKRFVGGGIVNPSNLFYNPKNSKTLIIEGEIEIGKLQYHRIALKDHISEEMINNNIIKIDGYISYKGIPYLEDSLGYNMVNVIGGVWFASDYNNDGKGKFHHEKSIKWSCNQVCKDWMRYPKQRMGAMTTKTPAFKDLLVENRGNIDVIIKSLIRRGREKDIKHIISEYFRELNGGTCVDFLENAYQNYITSGDFAISSVKVPYSVLITIDVNTQVDLYDTVEVTQEVQQVTEQLQLDFDA